MAGKKPLLGGIEDYDRMAALDSSLHRRDPRAKLIVALLAVVAAVSFPHQTVSAMLPLLALPLVWFRVSGTPAGFFLRQLRMALPFVFFVAIFNPIFDRQIVMRLSGIGISGGWLSFGSILIRFLLSISCMVLLVASTGFNTLCAGLGRLGMPKILVVQLLLLYRYIFLLGAEAQRMRQAYALRALSDKGVAFKVIGSLLGQLLLRVMARGERIHQAMLCRGFTGDIRVRHGFHWKMADTLFVLGCSAWILLVRFGDLPARIGRLVLGT